MNSISTFLTICLSALGLLLPCRAQDAENPARARSLPKDAGNPAGAEPAGHYLVMLEMAGKQPRLNVKIEGKTVKCVKSTDPQLEGMEGEIGTFRTQGRVLPAVESGYLVTMRNAKHSMSQIWIFRKDGRAAVREIPDRGEMQSAVPVKGNTLEPPK